MNIWGLCACLNEADIIESVLRHHLDQGLSHIYVLDGGSTDGTIDIVRSLPVELEVQPDSTFCEQAIIDQMAARAAEADYIVAFDADEYWVGTDGRTLAQAMDGATEPKLHAPVWHHYDWDHREAVPKPLAKVAFRYAEGLSIELGHHNVSWAGCQWGLIEVHELQYRSEDHFVRKVQERLARHQPGAEGGWHHLRFASMTEGELRTWWNSNQPMWGTQRMPVYAPIPSPHKPSSGRVGEETTCTPV